MRGGRFWEFGPNVDGEAELMIVGDIRNRVGRRFAPALFAKDLKRLGDLRRLRVWIHSLGGDLQAASCIYAQLRDHAAAVEVIIDGVAASAASLVAMAGDRVIMGANGCLMLHNPSIVGDSSESDRKVIDGILWLGRFHMSGIYARRSGLPRGRIARMMRAETWLDAEEAVRLGFSDEVDYTRPIVAAENTKARNKNERNTSEIQSGRWGSGEGLGVHGDGRGHRRHAPGELSSRRGC